MDSVTAVSIKCAPAPRPITTSYQHSRYSEQHAAVHPTRMQDDQCWRWHAGEAVAFNERAANVAIAVHGRDHPVMESYWGAVAKSKQQVRAFDPESCLLSGVVLHPNTHRAVCCRSLETRKAPRKPTGWRCAHARAHQAAPAVAGAWAAAGAGDLLAGGDADWSTRSRSA